MRLRFRFDHDESMLVCMNEITWVYLAPKDLYFAIPTHRMHMRMTDAETTSQSFESGVGHFIDIADRAIDDGAHAAEGAVHVAVHLAPEGADDAWLVEILHDDKLVNGIINKKLEGYVLTERHTEVQGLIIQVMKLLGDVV